MRLRDPEKRAQIIAVAARKFAELPFHKVRLDDVAAAAGVGKGTLYIYFKDKDDLYFSLVYDGFTHLLDELKQQLGHETSAIGKLGRIVSALVQFAFQFPHVYELMRTTGMPAGGDQKWKSRREELWSLIEETIRIGNATGEFSDPNPEVTARFLPGLVRAAMVFPPEGMTQEILAAQIVRLFEHGVANGGAGAPRARNASDPVGSVGP